MELAQKRLDSLTKPQGSLGVLEDLAVKLAGISGDPFFKVKKKAVVVMAGDHGVVEEGVSAFPQEVTVQMVANFINGGAAINVLSRHVGARVNVVDVGVAGDLASLGDPDSSGDQEGWKENREVSQGNQHIWRRRVRPGTANMVKGPAMTRAEAVAALEVGIEVVSTLVSQGFNLFATGEMGIGNTTPSSAILAVLGQISPEEAAGRGTGLDQAGIARKAEVIRRALEVNSPDPDDAIDVLSKVGGLEIAGLAGCIIGAAANRVPIVIDGFISTAAALIASRIEPETLDYMIASHVSEEQAHQKMLEIVGLEPMLRMRMRLGEGTGAALAMNIVEAATKIIAEMATFESAGVSNQG
ncbi:MAG: nicotinate-nucleotide--dimethylbenzimidazole phosphoribosyltransferase [Firmicutes bacterium]|nr:nicotinate-nucleotide--dimethylbenzimidazole phosphoribosyltransferase [Bacillota bacterium]